MRMVVRRFPYREFEVRRLFAADVRFRGICEDYEEAEAVLRRWQALGERGAPVASEYAVMLEELSQEIEACLDRFQNVGQATVRDSAAGPIKEKQR